MNSFSIKKLGTLLAFFCVTSGFDHAVKEKAGQDIYCNPLRNLMNGDFRYSIYKKDIPAVVLDSLKKFYHWPFPLGDINDSNYVRMTDTYVMNLGPIYDKLLHFALVNDSNCILSYTQGGLGVYFVIEMVKFKDSFQYIKYTTPVDVSDTTKLIRYFERKHIGNCK